MGVNFPEKNRYITLEWPLSMRTVFLLFMSRWDVQSFLHKYYLIIWEESRTETNWKKFC